MGKMASSTSPFSFLPLSLPPFPFCFRLDCQSLSHPVIVLVSVPFLTAQGAHNPNNHFLSLPFFGGRWKGLKLGREEGWKYINKEETTKLNWILLCVPILPLLFSCQWWGKRLEG